MDQKEIERLTQAGRAFVRFEDNEKKYPDFKSDQELKKPQPPLVKAPMRQEAIELPFNFEDLAYEPDLLKVINTRSSHRVFTEEQMSLLELSFLLWTSQGIKEIRGKSYATLRTVPCGGARHEFEVYLAIQNVNGLQDGLYHYLPMGHKLEFLKQPDDLKGFISASLAEQVWAAKANVVFYFSMVFYRAEWRYGIFAHRVCLIDAGHITENIYLAATALGLGSCAIGAVEDKAANEAFELDGQEESIFYAHPVGTISLQDKDKEDDFYAFVREQGL